MVNFIHYFFSACGLKIKLNEKKSRFEMKSLPTFARKQLTYRALVKTIIKNKTTKYFCKKKRKNKTKQNETKLSHI